MKTFQTLGLLLCSLVIFQSPAQEYEWSKSFGNTGVDEGHFIHLDDFGNVITVGTFSGTADLNPGPGYRYRTSTGHYDIFIQKLDSLGGFIWAHSIGSINLDQVTSVTTDSSGNIYIAVLFSETTDFDPGSNTFNITPLGQDYNSCILKLNPQGVFVWAKTIQSSGRSIIKSVKIDHSGNVLTTGTYKGYTDFDPDSLIDVRNSSLNQVFIHKLNSLGNHEWVKTFDGNFHNYGSDMDIDSEGNLYVTGNFTSTTDFDPGPDSIPHTSANGISVFVVKLDSVGEYIWSRSFGSASYIDPMGLCVDNAGSVYTIGDFSDTADFDPGPSTINEITTAQFSAFIHKIDSSGNFIWHRTLGGNSFPTRITSIAVDPWKNIYTSGFFLDTLDFDPGPGVNYITSAGLHDIFFHKLDSTGTLDWVRTFGSTGVDIGNSVETDEDGSLYFTGRFEYTIDFNPGSGVNNNISMGYHDAFVLKMNTCSTIHHTDVQTSCGPYTWIDGIQYTSSNNTATHLLTTINGCDSVVTLNLTIDSVSDVTTSVQLATLTANNPNASFQWLDCGNNFTAISGETQSSFTPSSNGSYAVQITENGCVDTSDCVVISNIGIVENGFGAELSVFPNPSNGDFTVDLGQSLNQISILITDLSGRTLEAKEYTNTDTLEFTLNQPAGVYLLTIQSGDKHAVVRLVKN
ncbi:MAG: hypothetical protein SchgKO_10600 [Schleiferiaceae bacterium]